MRTIPLFFILILLFGCTANTDTMMLPITVVANSGNITVSATFNETLYAGQTGHVESYDQYGSRILNTDFTIEETDLQKGLFSTQTTFKKTFAVPLVDPNISSLTLTIRTANATLVREWGIRTTPKADLLSLEVLEHENTYSIFVLLESKSGAKVNYQEYAADVQIQDKDGNLYTQRYAPKESETKNGRWNIIVQKKDVKESFYSKGVLFITLSGKNKTYSAQSSLTIKQMTLKEREALENTQLVKNSKKLGNKTAYVGFDFIVHRMGPLTRHGEEKNKEYVIAYVTVKNTLARPQYIAKSDFYFKDSLKNFYPVSLDETGDIPGLMMPSQEVTIPFGILTLKETETYHFYYGDKELAQGTATFE